MSKPYYTPARCTAEIPLSPFDGVVCGALADEIVQEGPRCDSCLAEFGGTPLTGEIVPDIIFSNQEYRLRAGTDRGQMWLIAHAFTREWILGENQTVLLSLDRYTELLLDSQLEGFSVGGAA